jgi:putative phosphoribosyl transferase
MWVFNDRRDAGRRLADAAARLEPRPDIVLALPRGGIPVGHEIAQRLGVPLDVVVVRKLGAPGHEEYAIGAIASGEVQVLDPEALEMLEVTPEQLGYVIGRERTELARREALFRGDRAAFDIAGKSVLLVDDGLATGSTMLAAIEAVRMRHPARIAVAVPIAAPKVCALMRETVEAMLCLVTPERLRSVGEWYRDFTQITDDEARALLGTPLPAGRRHSAPPPHTMTVDIVTAGVTLTGDLTIPRAPAGAIVFAHGSGSSRLSPRNRRVADALVRAGFATVLFDLLTPDEELADRKTRAFRFDIGMLAGRLIGALTWTARHPDLRGLPVGVFGASTGAAAALIAAARSKLAAAVVSRGGRPDLAGDALGAVAAPTLLVVGGDDREVLALNQRALAQLGSRDRSALHVVARAGHLFDEPGAIDEVIALTAAWFARHLSGAPIAEQRAAQMRAP